MSGIKVVILGDSKAGKSALVMSLIYRKFIDGYQETIGCAFASKPSQPHKLEIWDTSGAERYKTLKDIYIKSSAVIVYCFDLSKKPLDDKKIQGEIQSLNIKYPKIPLILVGTHSDACLNAETLLSSLPVTVQDRVVTSAANQSGLDDLEKVIVARGQEYLREVGNGPNFFQHPSAPKNFSEPVDKYCPSFLPKPQIQSVLEHIRVLQKEIDSCWPYPNKARKENKIQALQSLLEDARTMPVAKAIAKLDENFPSVRQGRLSTRTADLLNDLLPNNSNTSTSRNTIINP